MTYGGPLWGERTWGVGQNLIGVLADAHLIPERTKSVTGSGLVVIRQTRSVTADAVAVLATPIWREKTLDLEGGGFLIRETVLAEIQATAHMGSERTLQVFASALIWFTDYQQESLWLGGVQVYGELTERVWLGGDEIFSIWMGVRIKADAYVQADHRELSADAVARQSRIADASADGWIRPRTEVLCDAIVLARSGRIHPVGHAARAVPVPAPARDPRFDPWGR